MTTVQLYECYRDQGLNSHAGISLHGQLRSRHAGIVCRYTVGHDLVGTSSAEGERVSPQRARFERAAACRASPRLVFLLSPGGMTDADAEVRGRAAFRSLLCA